MKALTIVTLFSLIAGCMKETDQKKEKLTAVSTITIINDIVKQIGKEKVEAISICGVGYDPHTYKSVPDDSRKIASADIVFINGFGLEGWVNKLIENAGGNRPIVTVTTGITPLLDDKGHGDPDPHCWFNAEHAVLYVENILNGLIQIDSANKEFYQRNAEIYRKELDSLHQWTKKAVNSIPERQRILITSHDAFRYFGRAYDIKVEALQGISTEAQVQTADVARLIDLIKRNHIQSVFIETTVNPKLLEQIASETHAKVGGTLYSDSIGNEGTPGGSYIGAFKENVRKIVQKLGGDTSLL